MRALSALALAALLCAPAAAQKPATEAPSKPAKKAEAAFKPRRSDGLSPEQSCRRICAELAPAKRDACLKACPTGERRPKRQAKPAADTRHELTP